MVRTTWIAALAAVGALSLASAAFAEDFPATPMNAGPPMMSMGMVAPMAPMMAPAEAPPPAPMTRRQKRMMMKKKMMMQEQAAPQ